MDPLKINLDLEPNLLNKIRILDIKDIRSVDVDMLIYLQNGQQIVLENGALLALTKPELKLVFNDGTLKMEQLFNQIDQFHLTSPKQCDSEQMCVVFDKDIEIMNLHHHQNSQWQVFPF